MELGSESLASRPSRREWLADASEPALGARSRGHVKRHQRGPTYWSSREVTSCDSLRFLGLVGLVCGKPIDNWRYDLEPGSGGTDVTEQLGLKDTAAHRLY